MIEIKCCDRWEAYFRLHELGIVCECKSYQPLRVNVVTALEVIQIWFVVTRLSKSRQELASWLESCLVLHSN
ncbi:MAG: Asr1405/Asl0597 family protein [Leptolyngbyaceae cyanobacterium]